MKVHSLTRRLTATVLILEVAMGAALVSLATIHERNLRITAFDQMLKGRADTLFGVVEDSDDEADNVVLDMSGIKIPKDDIYLVKDEIGNVLGRSSPGIELLPQTGELNESKWVNEKLDGHPYRLVQFRTVRVIDPGKPGGGVRHVVSVLYGARMDHVWHEVSEAIRFYSIATLALMLATGLLMVWSLRRGLSPLYELAGAAETVTADDLQFVSPPSSRQLPELRPLAEAIEGAMLRLRGSLEQQRRFTSDAAHELKTEIAIAKSSLQLLALRPRTGEEYEHGLQVCLEDTARLERIVLEMLTYARVKQEARPTQSAQCALGDCVEEVVGQTKSLAELKSISVEFRDDCDAMVPLDEQDGTLLCLNLLLNALEHTGPGKSVKLELLWDGRRNVALTVEDEGEGIAEEDLPHLFEPFYRPDASRDRKTGGTGLGLSICEGICRQAGGGIEISSTLGVGTKVTVHLPVMDRSA